LASALPLPCPASTSLKDRSTARLATSTASTRAHSACVWWRGALESRGWRQLLARLDCTSAPKPLASACCPQGPAPARPAPTAPGSRRGRRPPRTAGPAQRPARLAAARCAPARG
jgi:hypothetical protein